jgi:hypothetical protein
MIENFGLDIIFSCEHNFRAPQDKSLLFDDAIVEPNAWTESKEEPMGEIIEETRLIGSGNSLWKLWRRIPQVVLMAFIYFLAMQFPDMSSAQGVIQLLTPLPADIKQELDKEANKTIDANPVRSKTVKAVTHMGIANTFFEQPLVGLPPGTPTFEFNLPGIAPVLFELKTEKKQKDGRIIYTGVARNGGTGTVILIVILSKSSLIGEIRIGDLTYEIRPAGEGVYSIYTVQPRALPPVDHRPGTMGTKPVSKALDGGPQHAVPVRYSTIDRHGHITRKDAVARWVSHGDGPEPILDVMVLFTEEAKKMFPPNSILDEIDTVRARMVESFKKSGIHADVNVVSKRCISAERSDYEKGDMESLIGQLQWDPKVAAWRQG